jgi:tetratricopeptide (TPR) repeat protein
VKLDPGNAMAERALGHAYQTANRFFAGERVLRALVEAEPRDAQSWYYLGALLYENNYYEPALKALERSLAVEPSNLRAQVYRAGGLGLLGRIEDAEAAYLNLLANSSVSADPELLLGYAQFLFSTDRAEMALPRWTKL